MNDNVLRGFCQKCGWPVKCDLELFYPSGAMHSVPIGCREVYIKQVTHEPEPVWFLSPKQMNIIRMSKSEKLRMWMDINGFWRMDASLIESLLESEPFLVASILKKADEE